jgi:arsenic resistance protein ArsH
MAAKVRINGDLNNTEVLRKTIQILPDPAYTWRTLAIPEYEDDSAIRAPHRPFLQRDDVTSSDWVAELELSTALKMAAADMQRTGGDRLKVIVLFGSLRSRSYSRLLAFECARILFRLGCDVRVFDPTGLPVKDDVQHNYYKVQELRDLSKWSDGHIWVSSEQHGNLVRIYLSLKRYPDICADTGHRRPCSTRSTGSR